MHERGADHCCIGQIRLFRINVDIVETPRTKLSVSLSDQLSCFHYGFRLRTFPQLGSIGFELVDLVVWNENLHALQTGLPAPFAGPIYSFVHG